MLIDELRRDFAGNPGQNRVPGEKTLSSVVVAECLAGSPADDVRNQ